MVNAFQNPSHVESLGQSDPHVENLRQNQPTVESLRGVRPTTWPERFGLVAGRLLAPITFTTSRIRHARMFHPDGVTYQARVETSGAAPDLYAFGQRLAGDAIVRLSSAWWRGKQWPDVLGLAIRFQTPGAQPLAPGATDQDILLATVRFPWTTPFAPLATRFGSFLWNHYHAVSPFDVPDLGKVKLRLRSPRLANPGPLSRAEHLDRAVLEGRAQWLLEARRMNRSALLRRWEPVATLTLTRAIDVDQAALRFSPFRTGRDVNPVGFVHYLRVAAYAASQRGRPT